MYSNFFSNDFLFCGLILVGALLLWLLVRLVFRSERGYSYRDNRDDGLKTRVEDTFRDGWTP